MEFNLSEKSFDEIGEKLEKVEKDIDPDKVMKDLKKIGSDAMKGISDLISEE